MPSDQSSRGHHSPVAAHSAPSGAPSDGQRLPVDPLGAEVGCRTQGGGQPASLWLDLLVGLVAILVGAAVAVWLYPLMTGSPFFP